MKNGHWEYRKGGRQSYLRLQTSKNPEIASQNIFTFHPMNFQGAVFWKLVWFFQDKRFSYKIRNQPKPTKNTQNYPQLTKSNENQLKPAEIPTTSQNPPKLPTTSQNYQKPPTATAEQPQTLKISNQNLLQLIFMIWITPFHWVMKDFRGKIKKDRNLGLHYFFEKKRKENHQNSHSDPILVDEKD